MPGRRFHHLPRGAARLGASVLPWTLLACSLALAAIPSDAQACGGTFCDANPPPAQPVDPGDPPPPPMPVDQTGETLIFAVDGDMIEAHIQIEFDPDSGAERFAWLIPLPEVPEFGVSSDAFFTEMQLATNPVFAYSSSVDFCSGGGGGGGGSGWGGSGGGGSDSCEGGTTGSGWGSGEASSSGEGSSGETGGPGGDDDSGMSGGPEVVERGFVGAFEYYVLDGGTVEGVMAWLENNAFDPNPDAEPILQEYLDQGHVFVAMKLGIEEGASAIHPIMLRYPGSEFCVPLKLTSIAAVDDMAVRVMVLGEERAAPANWRHVVPNPFAFDWLNVGSNYDEVIIEAIDEGMAEGHAWITQYAGASGIVNPNPIAPPSWDAAAFDEITPGALVPTLQEQGLIGSCDELGCEALHPLGPSILDRFLPVPEGVPASELYACPECYAGFLELENWDATQVSAIIEERIIGPGEHAKSLLATRPYLTRMTTRISPYEMTEDPTFLTNPTLPPVSLPSTQRRRTDCAGATTFTLDYLLSATVRLLDPNVWGPWSAAPSALRVEQIAATGAPQVLEDNTDAILAAVSAFPDAEPAETRPRNHGSCASGGPGRLGAGCACTQGGELPTPEGLLWTALVGLGLRRVRRR